MRIRLSWMRLDQTEIDELPGEDWATYWGGGCICLINKYGCRCGALHEQAHNEPLEWGHHDLLAWSEKGTGL